MQASKVIPQQKRNQLNRTQLNLRKLVLLRKNKFNKKCKINHPISNNRNSLKMAKPLSTPTAALTVRRYVLGSYHVKS